MSNSWSWQHGLPLTKESFQHAEHDENFVALLRLFDACSLENSNCEGCWLLKECSYIVDTAAGKCYDRLLQTNELLEFATRFMNLFTFKAQTDYTMKLVRGKK